MEMLDDFYHGFRQDLLTSAHADSDFIESEFADKMAEYLQEAGETEEFFPHFARDPAGYWRADGYAWDENTGRFCLFLTDFHSDDDLRTLTRTDADRLFRKGIRFLKKSLDPDFVNSLEETSPAFEIANFVLQIRSSIYRINLYILSDRVLSQQFGTLDETEVNGFPVVQQVWDIGRVFRLESSMREREDHIIDFADELGSGIQCLPATIHSTGYKSYLVVMPGPLLAELYGRWGSQLLEQNVRNFLQARGKVNKGIRKTIQNEPQMFFAYNNGLTATASQVNVVDDNGNHLIRSIRNLQIVNGAQTTASLFHAMHKDKADLSDISVQMKLSVIDEDQIEQVVPRISRYANSQNKVSEADFFSNHPFHQRIEEISRRLWAPATDGSQQESKWFYERTKGQYLDKQSHLTQAQKRKFRLEYPRPQLFTKTDLAKFENVWRRIPHTVSLGAQKNFANFAAYIDPQWETDSLQFNEAYFKHLIAKAIIFRHLEKLVSAQPWYEGGYRANIVAYTISYLAEWLQKKNRSLDFTAIWNRQRVGNGLDEALAIISKEMHDALLDTPENVSNVTEWAKKQACWAQAREVEVSMPDSLFSELKSTSAVKQEKKEAKNTQKIDDGIVAQKTVLEKGPAYWRSIEKKAMEENELTEKLHGILKIACNPAKRIPTEKQSKLLLELAERIEG